MIEKIQQLQQQLNIKTMHRSTREMWKKRFYFTVGFLNCLLLGCLFYLHYQLSNEVQQLQSAPSVHILYKK